MGRGVWQAPVHSVVESDTTEHAYAHTRMCARTHTHLNTHSLSVGQSLEFRAEMYLTVDLY